MRPWPFTSAELTAGLRRYFADSSVQVKAWREARLPPDAQRTVRGLSVDYTMRGGGASSIQCVVKEPWGATRAGLGGAGVREAGVYRSLTAQLPVETPAVIAADPAGQWLVLEAVDGDVAPDGWSADDYRRAIRMLAALHERFWGLSDDLTVYTWLARPLARAEFEIYVYSAASAVEKMITANHPRLIAGSFDVLTSLGQIIAQAEQVAAALNAVPHTLLHGDLRPSNVALQADDDTLVVFDWQLAALGPGVLDLTAFVIGCQWERPDLPVAPAELIDLYRQEMARRVQARWSDDEWEALWDYALIWRFTQEMFDWLTHASRADFASREAQFDALWLRPLLAAVNRRLQPVLYL